MAHKEQTPTGISLDKTNTFLFAMKINAVDVIKIRGKDRYLALEMSEYQTQIPTGFQCIKVYIVIYNDTIVFHGRSSQKARYTLKL